MIAISSYNTNAPEEILNNQKTAHESWKKVFSQIIFLNLERPTIKSLCQVASEQSGFSCIINADIICDPRVANLSDKLSKTNIACGISRRIPVGKKEPEDWGLDFFFARPHVWKAAAEKIPEGFMLGKILWDTWMLSFFINRFGPFCVDLSPSKLFYHPEHGHRGDQGVNVDDPLLHRVRWPMRKFNI